MRDVDEVAFLSWDKPVCGKDAAVDARPLRVSAARDEAPVPNNLSSPTRPLVNRELVVKGRRTPST